MAIQRANSSEIEILAGQIVRLPRHEASYIILSNRNYENGKNEIIELDAHNDGYKQTENEIYWGYSKETPHPLFPSETTFLLPVNNSQDIYLRSKNGRFVGYSIIL